MEFFTVESGQIKRGISEEALRGRVLLSRQLDERRRGEVIRRANLRLSRKGQKFTVFSQRDSDDKAVVLWQESCGEKSNPRISLAEDGVALASEADENEALGLFVLRPGQDLVFEREILNIKVTDRVVWTGREVLFVRD